MRLTTRGLAVRVRADDFRITRFRERRETTAIFVVDASGSSALQRLGEVKGAIELLLADCYVRRDSVALVAFRGKSAEILLPPTRSLARAKRLLAALPGGGGTPLAHGLDAAGALAESVKRKGQTPLLVLLTDGRGNIDRTGAPGRAQALDDALDAARRLRGPGLSALAINSSAAGAARADAPTRKIAEAMNGRYLKMPVAEASTAIAGGARRRAGAVIFPHLFAPADPAHSRAGRRRLAESRCQPHDRSRRRLLARAAHGRWSAAASAAWGWRLGAFLSRPRATACVALSRHRRPIFPATASRRRPARTRNRCLAWRKRSRPCCARSASRRRSSSDTRPAPPCRRGSNSTTRSRRKLIVALNGAFAPFGGVASHVLPSLAKALFLNPFAPRYFAWSADRAAVARLLAGTGSTLDARGVDLYARLMRNPAHVEGALAMMAHWDLHALNRDLPRLATPLALIVAANDRTVRPQGARNIAATPAVVRASRRSTALAIWRMRKRPTCIAKLIFDLLDAAQRRDCEEPAVRL